MRQTDYMQGLTYIEQIYKDKGGFTAQHMQLYHLQKGEDNRGRQASFEWLDGVADGIKAMQNLQTGNHLQPFCA